MSKRYMVMTGDARDGGEHPLVLSMIDKETGAKTQTLIAMFGPLFKEAAEKYAAWLNGQMAPEEKDVTRE